VASVASVAVRRERPIAGTSDDGPNGMVLAMRATRRRGTLALHLLTPEDVCWSFKDSLVKG
jgi:hypothetical protein